MKSRNLWMPCVLVLVGLGIWAGALQADEQDKDGKKTSVGKIVTVADDQSEFELQLGKSEQSKKLTIKVTEDTAFELDGEESTAKEALVVGAKAKVTHTDGVASKVSVTSAKAEHEEKDKAKGKDEDKGEDQE